MSGQISKMWFAVKLNEIKEYVGELSGIKGREEMIDLY